eukprot:1140819-Pelagomonas_calceolata.AAC.7
MHSGDFGPYKDRKEKKRKTKQAVKALPTLVYQRQLMKQDLSKTVVDDGNAGGPQKGSFSTDELRALFKVDVEKWMGLCLRMQPRNAY